MSRRDRPKIRIKALDHGWVVQTRPGQQGQMQPTVTKEVALSTVQELLIYVEHWAKEVQE